jgi:exopolysaccharide biosynthesis polyprenyl glycosylphosphotransferase
MTEQTMDVGEIRPVVTEWSPEEPRLESRVSPPGLGWEVFGTPADTPAPPVATVAVASAPMLLPARPGILSDAGQRAVALTRRRPADVLVTLECLAVAVAALSVMQVRDAYGLVSWVAAVGSLFVAARTHSQLKATSDLALMPALRSLAVVFAAASALSVLGEASHPALVAAAWIVILSGVVVLGALLARRSARRAPRVVVVGDRAAISRAAMRWSDGSVNVVGGVLAEAETSRMLEAIVGVPTIAGLDQAADWAEGRRADLVIVAPGHGLNGSQARQLAWSLERSGIRMAVADFASDVAPHRVQARRLGLTTVIEVAPSRRGVLQRVAKEAVDRVVGSLLLLCAAPLLATLMVAIRLNSRGGALFKQIRVGQDDKPFTMYKLRTMHVDAERQLVALRDQNEGAGVLFKIQEDPRVTRIGRLLRRTSLDELPQLINVVKGQMSLVGPRPALRCEVDEYDEVERRRLAVKPGMTGLWQVSGRSNLDWETSIALDLDYVDNWRVTDDLLIGLRTVQAVVGARGAY